MWSFSHICCSSDCEYLGLCSVTSDSIVAACGDNEFDVMCYTVITKQLMRLLIAMQRCQIARVI